MYNKLCVNARSMPFWCVGNPLGDPFGGPVQPKLDSLEVAQIIADAKTEGLIEMTSYHDDDLVPWDPEHPEDDLDPKSAAYAKLVQIRKILRKAGVKVNASICSLHGHPMFREGGLCNPDPKIRALAAKKVERTLRIGTFLGAKHYVYWVARDGFESYPGCDFKRCYDWLAEGLNHVTDYIEKKGLKNYIGGTVVARVCSEFIPKFSLTERSVVVYPVYNNRVRYNMGYFIGNSAWAPQYICWKNDGDPIISKVDGMKPGTQNELYLSGSSFYTAGDPAIKEATEQKTDVKVQPAYMQGPTWWRSDDKEHVHNYPIVKIFNRIWTVVTHNQLVDGRTCYYRASDLKKFTVEKWRVASVEDYENLKNGLTSNNISLPVQYMSDVEGGKDLTGFGIDWDTWEMRIDYAAQLDETLKKIEEKPFFFGIGKFITSLTVNAANNVAKEKMKMDGNQYKWVTVNSDKLMEYLATTKDGKFGHVRFNKNGSMEIITKDFDKDAFEMQVRMVQPLNPEMPKQAKK